MLTPEDIKNLTEYQKQVFVTKDEFGQGMEKIGASFSTLQTSVDAIAKDNKTKNEELTVLGHRVEKTEDWIGKAVEKVEIEFKH